MTVITSNVWYNSANTQQHAELKDGYYKGGGIYYNGNNSSVVMGHQPSLNVSNNITVISWFNVYNTSNGKSLVSKTDNNQTRGYDFYTYDNTLEIILRPDSPNNKLTITNSITNNTWYMGAFTYDGTTIKGYLNGNEINVSTTFANSATDTDQSLYIGGQNTANGLANVMFGKIGLTQIYSRALANSEIVTYFDRYRGRFGI